MKRRPGRHRFTPQDLGGGWTLERVNWNTWTEYRPCFNHGVTGMAVYTGQFCRRRDAMRFVDAFKAVTP